MAEKCAVARLPLIVSRLAWDQINAACRRLLARPAMIALMARGAVSLRAAFVRHQFRHADAEIVVQHQHFAAGD